MTNISHNETNRVRMKRGVSGAAAIARIVVAAAVPTPAPGSCVYRHLRLARTGAVLLYTFNHSSSSRDLLLPPREPTSPQLERCEGVHGTHH